MGLINDPAPLSGLSKQAITRGKRNVAASELVAGDAIFDYQQDGERKTRKTQATITETWRHGPCVTVLTSRGYVEYDAAELVTVAGK